jgi:hypothetical protein
VTQRSLASPRALPRRGGSVRASDTIVRTISRFSASNSVRATKLRSILQSSGNSAAN